MMSRPAQLASLLVAVVLATLVATGSVSTQPLTIVALGDSNTNGDGIVRASAWPAQLERLLREKGHDVRIRNAGVSGDTTAAGLARLDRDVPEGADAAIVFLGRNDLRLRREESIIRENLAKITGRLRERGVETLLVGFRPYDFSDIALANEASYYPDFFAGVTKKNGRKMFRYILPLDPVRHLNPSGHRVIAERILPSVEELVGRAAQ